MKLLEWFEYPKISSIESQYQRVPRELLLWHDRALLKNSFLVWDFENIGISFFEAIKAEALLDVQTPHFDSEQSFIGSLGLCSL